VSLIVSSEGFPESATSLYTQPLRVTLALHVLPLLLARAWSKLSDSAKPLLWSYYQQLTFTSQPTTKLIGSSHLNSLPKIPHCRQRTPLSGSVSVPMCPFFLTEWRSILDQVGHYPTSIPKTTWALAETTTVFYISDKSNLQNLPPTLIEKLEHAQPHLPLQSGSITIHQDVLRLYFYARIQLTFMITRYLKAKIERSASEFAARSYTIPRNWGILKLKDPSTTSQALYTCSPTEH